MPLQILTFGCRVNFCESELIQKIAINAGLANLAQEVVIINSCAVTQEAERQLRQTIRSIKRNINNKALANDKCIIVVGCATQIHTTRYLQMQEVSYVLGHPEKLNPSKYSEIYHDLLRLSQTQGNTIHIEEFPPSITSGIATITKTNVTTPSRARAFLKIQDGCNHYCTYCTIPFARGKSVSTNIDDIILQAKALVSKGYKEIVLTGIDITSYGKDLSPPTTLDSMVKIMLQEVQELPRLRLSSIDIAGIDDNLLQVIAHETRLMPHIHLSIQSGDDHILNLMKRRHNAHTIRTFCSKLRALRPTVTFGADIIVGFPTESEDMFQNTCNIIQETNIAYLHVFPYSERIGTLASQITPAIPRNIRIERGRKLRAIGKALFERHCKNNIGSAFDALIESQNTARLDDFSTVRLINTPQHYLNNTYDTQNNTKNLPPKTPQIGDISRVMITDYKNEQIGFVIGNIE